MRENDVPDEVVGFRRVGRLATETTVDGPNICSSAPEVYECLSCRTLVADKGAHVAWHDTEDELANPEDW